MALPSVTESASGSPTMAKFSPPGSSHVARSASGRPSQSAATTGPHRVLRSGTRSGRERPATRTSAVAVANGSDPSGVR
jgi:hypothetical protein